MNDGEPIACSLGVSDLEQRLAGIAAIGTESLVDRSLDGDRHLLRFRADSATRRRLEAIVAAEAECCSFLDLSLRERGDGLVLTVAASGAGRELADGLAAAFGDGCG